MGTDPDLVVWRQRLSLEWLSQSEFEYLESLPDEIPPVEWVWAEMDRVWHSFGLDNRRPLAAQQLAKFYSHPVWLMNGLFTAVDRDSQNHRGAIARYVAALAPSSVADYGGGFGELALAIRDAAPDAVVAIIEPYPSNAATLRLREEARIEFRPRLVTNTYDVVIAQDVLEHVERPIDLALELVNSLRPGGTIIFANAFLPMIECHLPATFYLRRTFPLIMRAFGLEYRGVVEGAAHAQIFGSGRKLRLHRGRIADGLARLLAPSAEVLVERTPAVLRGRLRRRIGATDLA